MSKKEDWKKELGISEYPWSSDDDDEEERSLSLSEFPVQRQRLNGTSDPLLPGPSASTPADANLATAAQKAQDKKDRDSFWAAINGPNRFAAMASSKHSSSSCLLSRSATGSGLSRNATGSGMSRNATGSTLSRNATGSGLSRHSTGCGLSRNATGPSLSRSAGPGISNSANNAISSRSTPAISLSRSLTQPSLGRSAFSAPQPGTSTERQVNLQNILETRQLMLKSTANLISISRDLSALLKARRRARSRSVGTPRAADDRPRQHRAPGGSFTAPPASKPIRIEHSDSDSSHDETEENVGDSGSANPPTGASSAPAVALEEEIVEIDVEPEAETSTESVAAAADVTDGGGAGAGDGNTAQAQDTKNLNETNAEVQPHGVKRKREADDDDDHATVKDFNQSLLKLLECPVCLESMSPPLAQCRRGHLVCGKCRARLAGCPVCRAAFSSVRNRAMEGVAEMVRYPCRHGCSREVHLKRRATHEASCEARRYRCPAPLCCARPMRRHDLPAHAQNKHLSILKLGRKHELSLQLNSDKRCSHLVLVYGEVFHLRVEVDVRTWGLMIIVTYLGPLSEASRYTYQVVVAGQYKGRQMVYSRETHSDLENPGSSTGQDCFHLTLDQALNYLRVKNRPGQLNHPLNLSVEILQKESQKGSESL